MERVFVSPLWRVLIVAAGVALSALVALVNASYFEDALDPTIAASIMPWGAKANADAAEDAYEAGHYGESERLARRSLDRALINVSALRVLGLSREAANPDDRSVVPIMLLASRLGWRDAPTNLWLIDAFLQAHEYTLAVQRTDALLREEEDAGIAFSVLRLASLDRAARKPIVATLVGQPKWRPGIFSADKLDPNEATGIEAIVRDLHRSVAPPTRSEMATLINTLIRSEDYDRAYRLWRLTTPDSTTLVYDMRFIQAARVAAANEDGIPFEWTVRGGSGSPTINYASDGQGGVAVTPPGQMARKVVTQIVHVPSGPHRLRVVTKHVGKGDESSLAWSLECLVTRTNILGQPTYAMPKPGIVSADYSFTVPDDDCAFQQLSLSLVPPMGNHDPQFFVDGVGLF